MSGALATAAVFNLVCTGAMTTGEGFALNKVGDAEVIIRVDLEKGRWCSGACEETAPLNNVTDTMIIFRRVGDVLDTSRDDSSDQLMFVNRESGEYIDRSRLFLNGKMFITLTMATCERADFTGFPERKF